MFFIIIGFVILNTKIVKADNITIDDIVNNIPKIANKISLNNNISASKNSDKLVISDNQNNVDVNLDYDENTISYTFYGDKTKFKLKDLEAYNKELRLVQYVLASILDLKGEDPLLSISLFIYAFNESWENITYDKNGIEVKTFVIEHGEDENDVVGEFIDSFKIDINKLNLDIIKEYESSEESSESTTTSTTTSIKTTNSTSNSAVAENPETGINSSFLCLLILVPCVACILLRNKNIIKKFK